MTGAFLYKKVQAHYTSLNIHTHIIYIWKVFCEHSIKKHSIITM